MIQCVIKDLRGEGVTNSNNPLESKLAKSKLQIDAEEFILDDTMAEFSYLYLCDCLSVDPEYIIDAHLDGTIKDWKTINLSHVGTAIDSGLFCTSVFFPLKRLGDNDEFRG